MSVANDRSGVAPPTLSLPNGGGAIRGLGGKLRHDEHTGVGRFEVPLRLPPGRDGFEPELVLGYSTTGGNGPLGLGWSLAIPAITRRSNPRYDDAEDVFVLSGVEDLVEIAQARQGTRREVRYRPRVEGLFARILHVTDPATGDDHWEVTARDGVVSRYGSSTASRIFAGGGGLDRIFAWHLDESRDPKGNRIVYDYRRDGGPQPPESGHSYRQVYLERIRYANHVDPVSAHETFLVHVELDYGQYDGNETATLDWDIRADTFSAYRAGFEVRTARLARRILIRSMDATANSPTYLVRSYDLHYEQDDSTGISLLRSLVERGYWSEPPGSEARDWDDAASDDVAARPHRATNLHVSAYPPVTFGYSSFAPERRRIEALSFGCGHPPSRSLAHPDHDLVDLHGGGLPDIVRVTPDGTWCWRNLGRGRFSGPRRLQRTPIVRGLADEGVRLADLDGDGSADLLVTTGSTQGFYENNFSGEWGRFHPLRRAPDFDLSDPDVRLVDVSGDGVTDVLSTRQHHILFHATRADGGYVDFAPPVTAKRQHDAAAWPDVFFSDPGERVRLADMTGDGLQDLVLLHEGRVDYWPNLGHNRWGGRVTLRNGPRLPNRHDPKRVFLTDVNGDGVADLVYVGNCDTRLWINQSGNAWGEEQVLRCTPPVADADSVRAVDLFGTGTGGLLWSSDWSPSHRIGYRFLDFSGGEKPLLLTRVNNHMGAVVKIAYRSSAEDYANDLVAGAPWSTTLPFPVTVVGRVSVSDLISGGRSDTEFWYHHGRYDGREREFCGFGRVDRLVTESLPAAPGADAPVLTRTWYHTGDMDSAPHLDARRSEYYDRDSQASRAHTLIDIGDAPAEAHRALAGAVLRTETYSPDGTNAADHPFIVVEHGYRVSLLRRQEDGRHAVFVRTPLESLIHHYERDPTDPRVEQALTLQVDAWGNAERVLRAAYPRRSAPDGGVVLDGQSQSQSQPHLVLEETRWINLDQAGSPYWIGVRCEAATSELSVAQPPRVPLTPGEAAALLQHAVLVPLGHVRDHYDGPDYLGLPLGQIGTTGLLSREETLALRQGQATALYGAAVTPTALAAAGYVEAPASSDCWWVQSRRVAYGGVAAFFRPIGFLDELGHETRVDYDAADLFPTVVTTPLGNRRTVEYDYRAFKPRLLTDANGNRSEARLDPFGAVLATARMGKAGAGEGDSLAGWVADVAGDPMTAPAAHLQDATSRIITRRFDFHRDGRPNRVHTLEREVHGSVAGQPSRFRHRVTYSDGFGREFQTKRQTTPGDVNGAPADPRWVCESFAMSGPTGEAALEVQPFFSATHEDEPYSPMMASDRYMSDALHRRVRTDHCDGTYARTIIGPWERTDWDENDAVADSVWYARMSAGTSIERDAAAKAYEHRATPARSLLDVLGRVVEEIADNGASGRYATRTVLDISGKVLEVVDASGATSRRTAYDLLDRPARRWERYVGESLQLADGHGNPVLRRDGQGSLVERSHDALNRTTEVWVTRAGSRWLAERTVYGESVPQAELHNLRGKVREQCSQAGVRTNKSYDFKGNLLRQVRRFVDRHDRYADWSAAPVLLPERYEIAWTYDAHDNRTSSTLSNGSALVARIECGYSVDDLPRTAAVRDRTAAAAEPVVHSTEYTASGAPGRIALGNGAITVLDYDPAMSRLAGVRTTTPTGDRLQDYRYCFDAVGNVTSFDDGAGRAAFFANQVVPPRRTFTYDAVGRLVRATGREHAAQPGISSHHDPPAASVIPVANAPTAVRNYVESYRYDALGNIEQVRHQAAGGSWTRTYTYQDDLLQQTVVGAARTQYSHDGRGNLTRAGSASALRFDVDDRLIEADLGGFGRAFYRYDSVGTRERKIVIYQNGTIREHVYLDDFAIHNEYASLAALQLRSAKSRCESVHAKIGERRVATVESLTVDNHAALGPQPRRDTRYQLADGLHSVTVELDAAARVVSFEEYLPFGGTAYHALLKSAHLQAKRWRFNGKETDRETGLYRYGARFYAPWLGRWLSRDPASDHYRAWSPYAYALDNPVTLGDPSGNSVHEPFEEAKRAGKNPYVAAVWHIGIQLLGFAAGTVGLIAGGLTGAFAGELSPGHRTLAVVGGLLGGAAVMYGLTVAIGYMVFDQTRKTILDTIGGFFAAIGEGILSAMSWVGRKIAGLFTSAPARGSEPSSPPTTKPKIDDVARPPASQPVRPRNIPLPGAPQPPGTNPFDPPVDELKPKERGGSSSLRAMTDPAESRWPRPLAA